MATYVVRTLRSGVKNIKVMVRRKNAPSTTRTFATRREAEAWAMSIEGEILTARSSPRVEADRHTLADAIARYVDVELARKAGSHKNVASQLAWWKQELGDLKLAEINRHVLCRCREKLATTLNARGVRRQPATVNRYLAAISHVLSVAVYDWGWLEQSPMKAVRKLKEARGRLRFLSEQERLSLLDECRKTGDPHLFEIVMLAIHTGMRLGEIVALTWARVDFERKRIVLLETKNGERRAVPLTTSMTQLLIRKRPTTWQREELVFPSVKRGFEGRPWDFRRAWTRALAAADIQDFRFHDLRHTCASYLAMSGATTAEIAEVLGHKTLQMVKRYAHLTESHVGTVLDRMEKRMIYTKGTPVSHE